MAERMRRSSGNVFRDLGFDDADAENLRVRSELMMRLDELIRKEGWTQKEAARRLGVTQPRISDLARGRIDRFSIDALVVLFGRFGMRVSFRVQKKAKRVA